MLHGVKVVSENRICIDMCDKCNRLLLSYGGKTVMIIHGFRCKYTTLTCLYEELRYFDKNKNEYFRGDIPKPTPRGFKKI